MLPQTMLAVTVSLLLGQAAAVCYFPNGDVSSSDVACNSNAVDSFCCFSEQACLSNGLCESGGGTTIKQYARGTCTDQNWQSGACPNFCLDEQGLGNPVRSCNTTTSDEYCCNDNCSCSSDTTDEVLSFSGTPYTLTVIGVAGSYPNPSATASSSATSSGSPLASTTALSTSTNGPLFSSSSGSSATAAAATSSDSGQSSSSKGSSNNTAVSAGIGVGVAILVLLVGGGAFWFYRRRSKARKGAGGISDKASPELPTYTADQSNYPTAQYHHSATKQLPYAPAPVNEPSAAGPGYSELPANRRSVIQELPGN